MEVKGDHGCSRQMCGQSSIKSCSHCWRPGLFPTIWKIYLKKETWYLDSVIRQVGRQEQQVHCLTRSGANSFVFLYFKFLYSLWKKMVRSDEIHNRSVLMVFNVAFRFLHCKLDLQLWRHTQLKQTCVIWRDTSDYSLGGPLWTSCKSGRRAKLIQSFPCILPFGKWNCVLCHLLGENIQIHRYSFLH